jgi:hypothetical protein
MAEGGGDPRVRKPSLPGAGQTRPRRSLRWSKRPNGSSTPRRQHAPGDARAHVAEIEQSHRTLRPGTAVNRGKRSRRTPQHQDRHRPPDRLRDGDDRAGHGSSGSPKPITSGSAFCSARTTAAKYSGNNRATVSKRRRSAGEPSAEDSLATASSDGVSTIGTGADAPSPFA